MAEDSSIHATRRTITRRSFLVSSVAAGFALAVRPICATTIHTDTQQLVAGPVSIPTTDGQIPGYRAMPAGVGDFPVILVVHEIFAVHEYIQDVCRRLAKLGYFAIAPDLYARYGDVAQLPSIDDIRPIVARVPDATVLADLDATVSFAAASGKGDTMRLGITGFCWGGRIVWLYAAHSARLKAGVAWYGQLAAGGAATPWQPESPIDVVGKLRAPVLGLYAGRDQGIPLTSIDQMRAALRGAGKTDEIIVYPDAQHGFHADYRPRYNASAAMDGWQRMQSWFKQHGV